jgi:hypothetical protein
MRAHELRPAFLTAAGEHPRGWQDLWAAFAAVIREPVSEPQLVGDSVWVDIVPPHPYESPVPYVVLSRKFTILPTETDNHLEARFSVTAVWRSSVDVGPKITEIFGRGPSSYEQDPMPPLDEFVAHVEGHPVVAVLRAADEHFQRWVAEYEPAEERD